MKSRSTHVALACAALLAATGVVQAQDAAVVQPVTQSDPTKDFVAKVNQATGLEIWGYGRGGFYSSSKGQPRGGYSLGGDLHKYRLGNEGDNYIEFGIGKRFDLGSGANWGVFYMPNNYNGDSGTAQAYATMTGLIGPSTLWAGQRYHRLMDVHIVDKQIVEDGDNYGAGIDDIPLGGLGSLNVAAYTAGSIGNKASNANNAKRLNFQWKNIPINPGGALTVTGGVISGDFAQGSKGGALGLVHKQKDFFMPGLNNAIVLQAATGHADITGKFYNLDSTRTETGLFLPSTLGSGLLPQFAPLVTLVTNTPNPGAKQRRILDAFDFQIGKWGGQGLIGYQTTRPDKGAEARDLSVGGRVSYGVARYTKLLVELGTTTRRIDNQATQRLNKGTVAVAFAPNTNFWTRPEFRIYATRASWNEAAALANASGFAVGGRRNATTVGVQLEAWWE